ncbi:sterol desaturase family protein [Xylophilus sp. ASV27]|uniref:sterol desaturase family protein n=1 Tax=Xylophilus sp. ASV27 TaxID=2795129 RepID=UPI0018EC150D|nr:sterol desaturase family protein [Xylophilus sp. ASV27]
MEFLTNVFAQAQQWLFEAVVQPLMFALGLASLLEDGYDATGWLLVGLLQIAVLLAVIGPLQRWRPVEPVQDRAAIRVDIAYTLLHRLGLFRVGLFFLAQPLFDAWFGMLRVHGLSTFHLDEVWPGVTDQPLLSLLLYLLAFDFLEYWIHRAQHQWNWWWQLHALHHSQRQMTMWSDNRNHLLDSLLHDCIVVVVAQLIGIAPGQFVAVVAIMQLSENFQHANLRLWFGRVGERLWVSPRFHRRHHSIGIGHEVVDPDGRRRLGSRNFGVLLPWWDMLFRTADFTLRYDPTGIRDQVEPDAAGRVRDYGRGFWAQQWLGLKRLLGRG